MLPTPERRAAKAKAKREASFKYVVQPTILAGGFHGYELRERRWFNGVCYPMPLLWATYTTKEAAQAACNHMNGVDYDA
jgi:hypothetical protein